MAAARPRTLHDIFSDAAAAGRPPYPTALKDADARRRLYREIRANAPDLEVGHEYWVSGLGHPLAWFSPLPTRPQEEWTEMRVKGRFRSVWGDDRGPYCVFTAPGARFETYFQVSVMRMLSDTVRVDPA